MVLPSYSPHRSCNYAFRVGREEFDFIISGLDVAMSKQFLEKIWAGIESLQIEHAESSVSDYVTVSFGACVIDSASTLNEEQLYIEADEALYLTKEKRNTVGYLMTKCGKLTMILR